jgi:hypothetical protein
MKRLSQQAITLAAASLLCATVGLMSLEAWAGRGGGGHARTSVNRGAHVNRNTNVNRQANLNRNTNINRSANVNVDRNVNRNVDRNINRNVDVHRYNDIDVDVNRRWNHPVGTAVAIGATAAIIGSIVYSLPPSCSMVNVGGITYQRCGSTWYQPRYAGTSVQYVVVNSPY